MLAFLLAILVGIAGLALLSTAFLFPGLYRKNDIIWGGVALFYALVLWICAQRITGAVLLGQTASVALTGWLGWQALMWRWSKLPTDERSTIADGSSVKQGLEKLKSTDWKSKLQSSSQKISNSISKGATAVEKTADKGSNAIKEVAAEVEETAEAVAETTASVVSDPREQAKDVAQAVTEKVEETVEAVEPAAIADPPKSNGQKTDVAATASAGLGAVTGLIGGLRDRLQGRKKHGKKYVRPGDEAEAKTTETTSYEADWEEAAATPAETEAETTPQQEESAEAAVDVVEVEKAEAEAEPQAQEEAAAKAKAEAEAKAREEAEASAKAEAEAKAQEEAAAKAEAQANVDAEANTEPEAPAQDPESEAKIQTGDTADSGESDSPEQDTDSGSRETATSSNEPNWPPVDESENDSWVDGSED